MTPPPATSKTTILVVEDDPDLGKLVTRLLESSGYRVLLAVDGEAGVAAAVAERPALILMDVKLPKLDGELAVVRLRGTAATAAIPIIMVTAMTDISDKHLAAQLGVADYVEKPFEPTHLLQKIQAVLHQPA